MIDNCTWQELKKGPTAFSVCSERHWQSGVKEIQSDLSDCSTKLSMFFGAIFGVRGVPIRLIVLNKIDKMDSQICFEMSFIVIEAIRGRCTSFTVLTATVWDIFGGQTNSSILVL